MRLLKKKISLRRKSKYSNCNWLKKLASSSLILLIPLLLSACGGQDARENEYFIPPTLSLKTSPIALNTPTPISLITPTPTIACQNGLTFIKDVNIPDGTSFEPGVPIEKVWLVQNSGSCNWDADYTLQLVNDESLSAAKEQTLFPARSGAEAEIRITFTAPQEPGRYKSIWQAFAPDDIPFGDPIYIDIIIE
jgi:hypothetical protein